MPSLPNLKLGRRSGADVVGLDIQPGLIAAVKARVNGSILAERAAALPLGSDTMREGEVVDQAALSEALRELFAENDLGKRVRVGIANQRTVMRTLELPGHRPQGARGRGALPGPGPGADAAQQRGARLPPARRHRHARRPSPAGRAGRGQRDMVEKLLAAVRGAGLTAEGVDLSAFALIRSLHHREEDEAGRVLYLNVDGLTNLAIAEGPSAASRASSAAASRRWRARSPSAAASPSRRPAACSMRSISARRRRGRSQPRAHPTPSTAEPEVEADEESTAPLSAEDHEAREAAMGYSEAIASVRPLDPEPASPVPNADVRAVLENGIREISGEVRNSLDFHRSQEEGGQVSHVALSGAALDLPGFAEALQASLGVEVRSDAVGVADAGLEGKVSTNRLSVAAGLARWRRPNEGRQPDPVGQPSGPAPGAGRSGGGAYAVLAVLGGLAILALLYGMATTRSPAAARRRHR